MPDDGTETVSLLDFEEVSKPTDEVVLKCLLKNKLKLEKHQTCSLRREAPISRNQTTRSKAVLNSNE
jgi:hypothetical protein